MARVSGKTALITALSVVQGFEHSSLKRNYNTLQVLGLFHAPIVHCEMVAN